ncbi:MAG: hypothetical protein R3247_04395 [Rhodothermales bacterium]|nr:hypothetical protein [Rhodothermales bacterium]
MSDYTERSAYPHPEEFEVMRPEYTELEDGYFQASITVSPFRVTGKSVTKPGARRAALYEAQKTYRSYHPSFRLRSPFPEAFTDQEGVQWERVPPMKRPTTGDYMFVSEEGEEDYADIEQMLMWDVRPVEQAEEA